MSSFIVKRAKGSKDHSEMALHTKRKDSLLQPATNGFYIKHAPKKTMSGVDETMTRLCASIAGQIYGASKAEDFKLNVLFTIRADVVHFEDHGAPYDSVTPDMVAVVSGSTMILGWQGSSTIMDFITDVHVVPVTSSRWSKVSKEIKVHGGFASIVENDLSCLESTLIKKMEEHEIAEVIMTGHSLGGALAQVAQLCIQAALHDKSSIWSQYRENFAPAFSVRTVAFSAPMSISTVAPTSPKTTKFLKEVAAKSCNIIYNLDVVPRAFSQLDFIDQALKNIIEGIDDADVFEQLNLPVVASRFIDVSDIVMNQYKGGQNNKAMTNFMKVAKTFHHYGNIIHYKNDASRPVVYRDFNHDKKSCDMCFSDLNWETQDLGMNIIGNITHDHSFTVRGPGLAYNIKDDNPGGLTAKCYMMDKFEVLRNSEIVGAPIPFKNFDDCVKKAKEAMHTASYGAVAVWNDDYEGREKFRKSGKLYIRKNVPGNSEDANIQGDDFWEYGTENKTSFWRNSGLSDWINERSPTAYIHDGVIELK